MVLCNENDWSYVHTIVVQGVNKKIYAIKNSLVVDWAVSGEIAGPGYKSYHIFHHPRHRPPHPGSPPPHNWSRGGRRRWSQWSRSQLRRVRGGEKEERLTWHFTSPSLAETGEAELVKVLAITQYSGMRGERVGDKTTLSSSSDESIESWSWQGAPSAWQSNQSEHWAGGKFLFFLYTKYNY